MAKEKKKRNEKNKVNYIEKFCLDNNLTHGELFDIYRRNGTSTFFNNPYFFDIGWNLYSEVTRTQAPDILVHLLKGDFIFKKIEEEKEDE